MSGRVSSAGRGSERLSARRRKKRRRAFYAFIIVIVLALCACVWGLQQPVVRISQVKIFGPSSLGSSGEASADQSLSAVVFSAMQGTYLGIIPCDSTFFFPEARIRADILVAYPDIAAISIFRNGLAGLSIKIDNRIPIARWCGSSPDATSTACYLFDTKGFIFATTGPATGEASATVPMNSFILYESLSGEPVGSTLPNATRFPPVFNFARQLYTFGSPVSSIVIRADEVDDYLTSGSRITYVLGNEQNTFTALVSARDSFNLADGSIQYIDLRFDRKMYVKKKE